MLAVETFNMTKLTHIQWVLLLVFPENCIGPQNENNHNFKVVQKEITVDTDTSDWQNIKAENVNLKDHLWIGQGLITENWQGPADLSFRWRAAYNKSKLYFLFEVADDTIGPFNRPNTWLNDCIELCIDPGNKGGIHKDSIDGKMKLNGYEMHFLPSATPHEIRAKNDLLKEFQEFIRSEGIETEWPNEDELKR